MKTADEMMEELGFKKVIDNDTEIEKTFCFTSFPPTYKTYVKCPECDKEICLGTKIVYRKN